MVRLLTLEAESFDINFAEFTPIFSPKFGICSKFNNSYWNLIYSLSTHPDNVQRVKPFAALYNTILLVY